MDTGFDTAKIAYGDRPFIYKPPPGSIQATHWIGVASIAASIGGLGVAAYSAYAFGFTQFVAVAGLSAGMAIFGTLACAFAQACKAQFDTLQIVAYKGKY